MQIKVEALGHRKKNCSTDCLVEHTSFCIRRVSPHPLLTILTTQASKQENTPEWKTETSLFNICSIKWTLEVFPIMSSCLGPCPIEKRQETIFNTTAKWHKLLQTATHGLHCFTLIVMYNLLHESKLCFANYDTTTIKYFISCTSYLILPSIHFKSRQWCITHNSTPPLRQFVQF